MSDQPAPTESADRWNERYVAGDLPWDSALPCPQLIRWFEDASPSGLGLDLGCGAGTNAIYIARRADAAVGVDISSQAIEMARQRAADAGVTNVRFMVCDLVQGAPKLDRPADFAFDRGCLHSVDPADRPAFARHVADVLVDGGWWLSQMGSADEPRAEGETGPPQLTVADIGAAVEGSFEVHQIRRTCAHNDAQPTHLFWSCLLRKRRA